MCLAFVAALLLHSRVIDAPVGTVIALPFALLCVNLLAALAVSHKLRRQGGLLIFHLALAGVALVAALDNLTALHGHVEVTEGAAFDDGLVEARAGPLHDWHLDEVRFVQGDFLVNYAPGLKRRDTVSNIIVQDGRSGARQVQVGDDRPLIVNGYRFYTSFNKGYAPLLTYVDGDGRTYGGAVHLPSYPLNYFKQGNGWDPPDGSPSIKLWLRLAEPVYAEDEAWRFHKPDDAVLVVIDEEQRRELSPGESIALGPGTLRYDGVRSWMGYTISYEPFTPWLVAAALIAALGLVWHLAAKFLRSPWQAATPAEATADDN